MILALTSRGRGRPTTRYGIPHQQLDQNPSTTIYSKLLARFVATPDTTNGPSLISVPGARALFLADRGPCNAQAFFRGREFAHIHPPHDGSFHMALSSDDCQTVLEAGWGELHPLAASGRIAPGFMMIYAPCDDAEIETVLAILRASLRFAMTPTRESRP